MNVKLRGTLCGVGAAVFYGTNPLGAMNLYQDGISANSTLFYRFGLAIVMLGVMMLVQRKKFGVTRSELLLLAILGMFMGSSSASLFISFNYMDVGIASTLLFVYPVMVAVIMALLFKEKVTPTTARLATVDEEDAEAAEDQGQRQGDAADDGQKAGPYSLHHERVPPLCS